MTFYCPICGEVSHVLKMEAENRRLQIIETFARELSDRPSNLARTNLKEALEKSDE